MESLPLDRKGSLLRPALMLCMLGGGGGAKAGLQCLYTSR